MKNPFQKAALVITSLIFPGQFSFGSEDKIVPESYPESRYAYVWLRGPFEMSGPRQVAAAESFAKDLSLAGILRIGDELIVHVQDRKTGQYLRLSSTPDANGIRLVDLKEDSDLKLVVATLAKGAESAEVRYDLVTLAAKPGKGPIPRTPPVAETHEAATPKAAPPVVRKVRRLPPDGKKSEVK